MLALRAFRFAVVTALLVTLASTSSPPAYARARLIAVVTFRSTVAAHHDAVLASRALAARLAQEPGWDATTINPGARDPADAAAAVGAEVYVIGQYFPGRPARVVGASFRVATAERLNDFSFSLADGHTVPGSVSFGEITAGTDRAKTAVTVQATAPPQPAAITIPSGDLISVMILKDIGSRISQEGDTFAVETVEDYYYKGQLILPKGSPGYGVITHLKRAGSFHAGGELNFTVKRLVTPSKTDILVETNGATADADKETEHNGNAFGQYLLWGVGMFAKRGNDILIKKGTTFHVSTLQNDGVPLATPNAQPAALDPAYVISNDQVYVPQSQSQAQSSQEQTTPTAAVQPQPQPQAQSVLSTTSSVISPPANWLQERKDSVVPDVATLGYWRSPHSPAENLEVVMQAIPTGMQPSEFADLTVHNLRNAVGASNVHAFKNERICGGKQDGWFIESEVTVGITPVIAEQTLGLSGSQSYVATYRRPATTPESVAAREALDTLCAQADA